MTERSTVDLALAWLASSDIRHIHGAPSAQGGVNQGYNWQERSYPFIYSEITGYAVSALVNAYRWTGNDGYLSLARQSADFLLRIQGLAQGEHARGAIPHGLSLPDLELKDQYYSFDAAMCLQGLLDLHAVSPAPELLRSAQAIADWLLSRMQLNSGAFLSCYDADTDEWQHASDQVFGDSGCLHAKHAIGLLRLASVSGDDRYRIAAEHVCDWVEGLQDDDGAFRPTENAYEIVSHPHCYATEGLLFAYQVLGTERYLTMARRAGEWLLKAQNGAGAIAQVYKQRWWRMGRNVIRKLFPRRVTDATAQAIRIWLSLYSLEGDRRFLDACHRAKGFLCATQCVSSPDGNAVGGFYYWPGHPMMFAWCAMFAMHALHALEHISRGDGYRQLMAELF